MDVKDLRTEAALSERNNDGSKYSQGVVALQCNRNKSYQDIGSNTLAKTEGTPVRPCAVIGPDRVLPPPASNDAFLKKGSAEPWPSPDNAYRRPPDYPHRLSNVNPTRNISPRQTFQENMPRINVPPTYPLPVKHSDSANFNHIQDRNVPISKNIKPNMAPEAKYCDVPYAVNNLANEHKTIRESEMYMQSVNSSLTRTVPHVWTPGNVNVAPPRTYSASETYQYQQYPNCASQRPAVIPMPRPHRTLQEEATYVYPEHYFPDANARFKPFPHVKERYAQSRYEYLGNYPGQFHPPPPVQPPKYDMPKTGQSHPYPVYPHLKYLENRVAEPTMEGYQRQASHQPHYNIPFRNQIIHPPYAQVSGSTPQKVHQYAPDAAVKAVASNKLHYDNNNKMYIDYDNSRSKPYPVTENYYVNEMSRYHQLKNQIAMPNYSPLGMRALPSQQYYLKDNPQIRPFEYMPHFRNFEHHLNVGSVLRHAPQFSPNTLAISPTDSSASNDTTQTHGTSQEDCGYVSQSSTASVRSIDSGIYRLPHEYYKKPEYKYGSVVGSSPTMPKIDVNKDKQKQINVRQFLSMWNEEEEENLETKNSKEIIIQTGSSESYNFAKNASNQDQLYVLGLVNVPSEELSKYEHIEKISKLPENIKGYNNLELYSRFEEAMESCNTITPKVTPKEYHMSPKDQPTKVFIEPLPRPVSPLDVEAKISQSVIHKEVGCNFEIRPCTPKMMNVEVAAPAQNVLSERVIEKLTNPHSQIVKSPLTSITDENCHTFKNQDNNFTDNPSCKMTRSPYSSNNMEPIKANYTIQDLEINSGVCLASLPRLDNEIELNFPEVNQQFINANKGDRHSPANSYQINIQASGLPDSRNNQTNSEKCKPIVTDSEKSLNKLTKYRKLKANVEDTAFKENVVRTDSVIIKNPENLKNIEDKFLENSGNPLNLCSPINLTSQSTQWHNSPSGPNETNDPEMALDFSLNKPSSDLPIIEMEKDTKQCETNSFSSSNDLPTEHDLSDNIAPYLNDAMLKNNEIEERCIKTNQINEEKQLCSREIVDIVKSNDVINLGTSTKDMADDLLIVNSYNECKSNDASLGSITCDSKQALINIQKTFDKVIPEQSEILHANNKANEPSLISNEKKDLLDGNKNEETLEIKYNENIENNVSPNQFYKIEQVDNDFEHDEISANLEKMFRENDEETSKNVSITLNTEKCLSNISEFSEISPTNTRPCLLPKTNSRFSKELFSPWIQKLLIYNEGFYSFEEKIKTSSIHTLNNTSWKSRTTEAVINIVETEVNKSAPMDIKSNDVSEDVIDIIQYEYKIKKRPCDDSLEPMNKLDNILELITENKEETSNRILPGNNDSKKIKKICTGNPINNSSSKSLIDFVGDVKKKNIIKLKRRVHQSKIKKNTTKCLPEIHLETNQIQIENKQLKSDNVTNKREMMTDTSENSNDCKGIKIDNNILQTCSGSSENQNTQHSDISTNISESSLNIENDANEILLTENYSKILDYCNTPEDEEHISKHVSDDCTKYQKTLEPHVVVENCVAEISNKSVCLNTDVDDTRAVNEKPVSKSESNDTNEHYLAKNPSPAVTSDYNDISRITVDNNLSETIIDDRFEKNPVELEKNVVKNNENNSSSSSNSNHVKEVREEKIEKDNKCEAEVCRTEFTKSLDEETFSERVSKSVDFSSTHVAGNLPENQIAQNKPKDILDKDHNNLMSSNQNYSLCVKCDSHHKNHSNTLLSLASSNKVEGCSIEDNVNVSISESETDKLDIIDAQFSEMNNAGKNTDVSHNNDTKNTDKVSLEKSTENDYFAFDNTLKNETIMIKESSDDCNTTMSSNCEINLDLHVSEPNEAEDNEAIILNNDSSNKSNDTTIEITDKTKSVLPTLEVILSECKIDQQNDTNGDKGTEDFNESDIISSAITNLDHNFTEKLNNEDTLILQNNPDNEVQTDISSKCHESDIISSAITNLDHNFTEKINNEDTLILQNNPDNEVQTDISTKCQFTNIADLKKITEDTSFVVPSHKHTESTLQQEREVISTNVGIHNDEQLKEIINNDLHIGLTIDLHEAQYEQNKATLRYEKSDVPINVSEKWIADELTQSPEIPNFPTTDEDFILYDNSEEKLCYPVIENSFAEIENETIMPDTCIPDPPVKQRLTLKRSYSDSALNSIKNRGTSERQLLDNTPMWPPKRKKVYEFNHTEQQIINDNICDFIQNNRRNSVSSYYNAENVSFCILIDNDCILTDENDEEKICFAEVTEDCITETSNLEENIGEIVCCSQDNELDLSDSIIMDYNNKSIQESWLDDVACVETVVSDDIAEETSNDVYLSPSHSKYSDYEESGILKCDESDLTTKYNVCNEGSIIENASQIGNPCRTPFEDEKGFYEKESLIAEDTNICSVKSFENIAPISYNEDHSRCPTSDYTSSVCVTDIIIKSELPEDKENLFNNNMTQQSFQSFSNHIDIKSNLDNIDKFSFIRDESNTIQNDEVNIPESSMDSVFNYNTKEDDDPTYSPTSSSPEVSSTTSEEKSSGILLKITNYNGSRVSEINEVSRSKPRCKFTESKDYSNSQEHFPKRPLLTKAARKYIPPLKESIRDFKVKLPLPQPRLLKLRQLKIEKTKPKVVKQISPNIVKKPKPNFEDVLKSIDEVQIKMHKEKNKKTKNIVPKVVIKKNGNGSHYTSSSSKHTADPDLTGRKWQPWVFLEKNSFIDNMAIRNKNKAIFSRRKNTYVLAENFQKYKSVGNRSAKFVISQPNAGDSSKGKLKYTIRLKHIY